MALRARLAAFRVEIAEKAVQGGRQGLPGGVVDHGRPSQRGWPTRWAGPRPSWRSISTAWRRAGSVARHESKMPRVAVWHTWEDTEAVGWIRFVLDREKVPYAYIRDEDVRAGRLRDKYDVIIFGHNYLGLQDQIHGIDKKFGPMAYMKTKETPNLGVPDASADITGGIGWQGVAKIEEFLNAGGVLITLGNGSTLPLEGGLVRDVYRKGGAFFIPGSELRVKFTRPDHPLAYGSPEVTSVFRSYGPVYDIARSSRKNVVMQWGTKPRAEDREEEKPDATAGQERRPSPAKKPEAKMLVSGALKGEDELEGRPAIMDFAVGKGRVVPSTSIRSTATSTGPTTGSSGTPS